MKRLVALCMSVMCLGGVSALAQDDESRFKAGEFEVSPFAAYVDKIGDDWGVGASLSYFVTDKIGVGATTYWTDFGGTFIDNLAGEAQFRLPLFKSLAPYAVGSVGYQFDSKEWFETLGVGLDFRPFDKISAFGDVQYRFANETRDGVMLRLGVRFAL